MSKGISQKMIDAIRKKVINGRTKYQVARELGISDKVVYYHTRDIPSKTPGRTEIRGRTLDTLKILLTEGHVTSTRANSNNLRTLQKHFKVIKRAQLDGKKSVYYLKDQNREALQKTIEKRGTKVMSYHKLASMSQVFGVNLSNKEKHSLLGRKKDKSIEKNHSSKDNSSPRDGGFLGRFLHSEVLGYYY